MKSWASVWQIYPCQKLIYSDEGTKTAKRKKILEKSLQDLFFMIYVFVHVTRYENITVCCVELVSAVQLSVQSCDYMLLQRLRL